MGLLQEMTVKYSVDLSALQSGTQQAKDAISGVGESASSVSSGISDSLSGAGEAASSFAEMFGQISASMTEAFGSLLDSIGELQGATSDAASNMENSMLDFESSVSSAGSELDSLASSASDAEGSLSDLASQAETTGAEVEEAGEQSSGGFSGAASGLLGFGSQLGQTVFGAQAMIGMAGQLATGLLAPAEQAENTKEAFDNLLGSTSAASDEIQKLNTFAAQTQFQTSDIDEAGEKLIGFGISAQNVVPDLKSIGDALSAVGKGTPAELNSVVGIFGKMSVQGKITQADITELGAHGINAMQAISLGAGKSTDDIKKMIKDGTLPANQAIADLTSGIEKNPMLSGGMAKQSQTLSGQMSTLKSDTDQLMASMISPALPEMEKGIGDLTTLMANPGFQKFAATMGKDVGTALEGAGQAMGTLVTDGQQLFDFFSTHQDALNGLGAILLGISAAIMMAVIPALVAWAIAQVPVMIETLATVGPYLLVALVVAAVVFGVVEAIQHWGAIMSWLGGICGDIGSFVGGVFSGLGTFLHGIIGNIGAGFSAFGTLMSSIWNGVVNSVKGAINWIIGDINSFIGFIDGIQIHIPAIGVGPVHTPAFDWNGVGIPKIPLLATGGQTGPGWFVAGEEGPELVNTNGGATVYNRSQTSAMMQGGSQAQETHVHIHFDGQEIAHYTADAAGQIIVKQLFAHGPVRSVAA